MQVFQNIVKCIIRPSRDKYGLQKLGPNKFQLQSKIDGKLLTIKRQDQIITNRSLQKLHLSHFRIAKDCKNYTQLPTIIYLHSNSGSRQQGFILSKMVLERQFEFVIFDSSGSGLSQGDFITLGMKQSDDLVSVIQHLQGEHKMKDFALWGRSMGAATALLFASKYSGTHLKACIYDSPFSSLKKLIKQIASNRTGLPNFVIKPLMAMVDVIIRRRISFGIEDLKVKDIVHLIKVPGYFLTSKRDSLVACHHVEKLFHLYPAQKHIQYIDSEHHTMRSISIIQKCINFIQMQFQKDKINLKTKRITGINLNQKQRSMKDILYNAYCKQQVIDIELLNSKINGNTKISITGFKSVKKTIEKPENPQQLDITQTTRRQTDYHSNTKVRVEWVKESNKQSDLYPSKIVRYLDEGSKTIRKVHVMPH